MFPIVKKKLVNGKVCKVLTNMEDLNLEKNAVLVTEKWNLFTQ